MVWYNEMEQLLERILEDGLEENLRKQGLPSCVHPRLEYAYQQSVHDLLWQLIPVGDYSNAGGMLATPVLHRCWWILKAWPWFWGGRQELRPVEIWEGRVPSCTCIFVIPVIFGAIISKLNHTELSGYMLSVYWYSFLLIIIRTKISQLSINFTLDDH